MSNAVIKHLPWNNFVESRLCDNNAFFLLLKKGFRSSESKLHFFFFFKNTFYKNIETEICEILRTF